MRNGLTYLRTNTNGPPTPQEDNVAPPYLPHTVPLNIASFSHSISSHLAVPLHFTASCFVGHDSHFTATQAEERSADDALLAQRNGGCAQQLAL